MGELTHSEKSVKILSHCFYNVQVVVKHHVNCEEQATFEVWSDQQIL